MPHNAFLITGANAGLGKDVARQLGLRADVDSIYLACRDEAKAQAAQADLRRITGRSVFVPYVGPIFGISHSLEVGAKRLVDALVGGGLHSGGFYASAAKTLTGPLFDQSSIVADFADQTTQDHAYQAIHRFLDKRSDHVRPG